MRTFLILLTTTLFCTKPFEINSQVLSKVAPLQNQIIVTQSLSDTINPQEFIERYIYNYRIANYNRFIADKANFRVTNVEFLALPLTIRKYVLDNKTKFETKFELN